MWVFLPQPMEFPVYNHPIGTDYKWYISGILPANWVMKNITYIPPFMGNQETTIDPSPSSTTTTRKPGAAPQRWKPTGDPNAITESSKFLLQLLFFVWFRMGIGEEWKDQMYVVKIHLDRYIYISCNTHKIIEVFWSLPMFLVSTNQKILAIFHINP